VEDRRDVGAGPLRICYVTLQFWPSIGGTQSRVEKEAGALRALGHEVSVVTLRHRREWPATETHHGVPVARLGGVYRRDGMLRIGRLAMWPVSARLSAALWRARDHYDVLQVMQLDPLATAAALVGRATGKPVVVSVQNSGPDARVLARLREREIALAATAGADADSARRELREIASHLGDASALARLVVGGGALLALLRRSGAWYQVLSAAGRDHLVQHGFPPSRIVRIPGNVDTDLYRPADDGPAGGEGGIRVVTCVARLEYNKGIDVLLHAWARLARAGGDAPTLPAARLRLVGEGSLRRRLEAMAADLGIAREVEFAGELRDIPELLRRSWGFVLPSRWEGMPNALLEAMACGLPCVATRVSGSEEVISDGVDGLLVEAERPDELAEALRRIIGDDALARRLGGRARATVVEGYRVEVMAERYVALYRRLMARAGAASGATIDAPVLPFG
jgi:glycosyltransferase involved in cell wall biosynthesis